MNDYPSFVRERKFWQPERGGSYGVQCARGRGYAEEILSHVRATGSPNLLGSVVRAMIEEGTYGGVEVGFCAGLGEAMLHSSGNTPTSLQALLPADYAERWPLSENIRKRANRAIQAGKTGDALKLHILSGEVETIKEAAGSRAL